MINAAAINATLATIKRIGSIEELALIHELVDLGWSRSDIETALTKIADWACHGLWDLNVPVTLDDGVDCLGAESLTYIWN